MPTALTTVLLVLAVCAAILAAPLACAVCGGAALLIEMVVFYLAGAMSGLG